MSAPAQTPQQLRTMRTNFKRKLQRGKRKRESWREKKAHTTRKLIEKAGSNTEFWYILRGRVIIQLVFKSQGQQFIPKNIYIHNNLLIIIKALKLVIFYFKKY